MAAIMVSRSDATEWQTDIFFQFDFQNTAGTVPGIIKTTGRVLGEKQIAAAATFGKAVAFIPFSFLVDTIAKSEIFFQSHFDQKYQCIHMRSAI